MHRGPTLLFLVCFALFFTGCRTRHQTPPTQTASLRPGAPVPPPLTHGEPPIAVLKENFRRVHFLYDSATMTPESHAALAANAALLRRYPALVVEVQGHADHRGSTGYNLALGQRRAAAVVHHLSALQVPMARLTAITYGEERPLGPASGDVAWAANRRAEFRVLESPQGDIAGTIRR